MNALKRTLGIFLFLLVAPFSITRSQVPDAQTRKEIIATTISLFQQYGKDTSSFQTCFSRFSGSSDSTLFSTDSVFEIFRNDIKRCDPRAIVFVGKKEVEGFENFLSASYLGVGMRVVSQDSIIVVYPFTGFPAERAGLLSGDTLIRIDSIAIAKGLPLDSVARLIWGPVGTPVTISVRRNGQEVGPVIITREKINIPSVVGDTIDSEIGYIAIRDFRNDVDVEFMNAMHRSRTNYKIKGLVVDIRGNPGGNLNKALSMLETHFSPDQGAPLVFIIGRTATAHYVTRFKGYDSDIPVVVITDKKSASAAEIFAGVLQVWGVTVVGDTTFGKGSVQIYFHERSRSGVEFIIGLTTAEYCIGDPCKEIEGVGVVPDYVVPSVKFERDMTKPIFIDRPMIYLDRDIQLQKAIEVLRQKMKP